MVVVGLNSDIDFGQKTFSANRKGLANVYGTNCFLTTNRLSTEQHKMLIQRLSDLSKAIEASQSEVTTVKTLDFVVDYTDFHFSAEEKHMMEQNYPGLEHQRQQHAEFKGYLKQLVEDFEEEGPVYCIGL